MNVKERSDNNGGELVVRGVMSDSHGGELSVVEDPRSGALVLAKELRSDNPEWLEWAGKVAEERLRRQTPALLSLLDFGVEEPRGEEWGTFTAFFDSWPGGIGSVHAAALRGATCDHQDVTRLLYQLLEACATIQSYGGFHGAISPDCVHFNPETKVAKLFSTSDFLQSGDDWAQNQRQRIHLPCPYLSSFAYEQLWRDAPQSAIDPASEDMFAVGLLMLELTLGLPGARLYRNGAFDAALLAEWVQLLQTRFESENTLLTSVVAHLLVAERSECSKAEEILARIPPYEAVIGFLQENPESVSNEQSSRPPDISRTCSIETSLPMKAAPSVPTPPPGHFAKMRVVAPSAVTSQNQNLSVQSQPIPRKDETVNTKTISPSAAQTAAAFEQVRLEPSPAVEGATKGQNGLNALSLTMPSAEFNKDGIALDAEPRAPREPEFVKSMIENPELTQMNGGDSRPRSAIFIDARFVAPNYSAAPPVFQPPTHAFPGAYPQQAMHPLPFGVAAPPNAYPTFAAGYPRAASPHYEQRGSWQQIDSAQSPWQPNAYAPQPLYRTMQNIPTQSAHQPIGWVQEAIAGYPRSASNFEQVSLLNNPYRPSNSAVSTLNALPAAALVHAPPSSLPSLAPNAKAAPPQKAIPRSMKNVAASPLQQRPFGWR